MGESLHATVQRNDVGVSVKLAGVLDEDNHLANLMGMVSGQALIDLGDIETINSCGARDWVNWIAQLEARGIRPVLVECSPAVVAQLNLVRNFAGNAVVKSFYVPYHCPQCDEQKVALAEVAELGPPPHEPPSFRCDECETLMDFDDVPEAYFGFLSERHHASAKQLQQGRAKGSTQSIKVRSRASKPVLASRTGTPSLPPLLRPDSQPALAPTSPAAPAANTAAAADPRPVWPLILAFSLLTILAIAGLAYLVATA